MTKNLHTAGATALGLAALIILTGCSLLPGSAPAPSPTGETPAGAAPFVYEDEVAGFAITFPGEPEVEGIDGNEEGAQRATYTATPPEGVPFYTAGGTKASASEADPETFELIIARMEATGFASDIVDVTAVDLDGIEGRQAEFVVHDGNEASMILAGKGHSFYQLMVIGGTADERQAFFDTFELLD